MKDISVRDLTQVALFAALIAIGAFITIPFPTVPISLQSLMVFLAGLLLSPKKAFLASLLYMVLGLIGLPVFAGMVGGVQTVLRPSFGFVIGFVLAAPAISLVRRGGLDPKTSYLALIIGEVIIYAIGLPYMVWILQATTGIEGPVSNLILATCLTLIPGDVLKIILAFPLARAISRAGFYTA